MLANGAMLQKQLMEARTAAAAEGMLTPRVEVSPPPSPGLLH